jgi:Tfp pilus assembly protein PilN
MIRINLAPTGARPRAPFRLQLPSPNLGVLFLVVYVVAGAGVGFYWWRLSSAQARLTTEIARAQSELAALRAIVGQSDQVKAQVAELRQRVQTIQELTKSQSRSIQLFDAFVDVVPTDLWITGLEERGTVLKVSGTAFSTTAVADLMANLRRSGRFKEVDITLARQDLTKSPRLVTFEVTCRFES